MPVAFRCRDRDCAFTAIKKWIGPCPGCHRFYDIKTVNEDIEGAELGNVSDDEVQSLQDYVEKEIVVPRLETQIEGFDYVLGGGFATNSVTLITGDPGAGKSTAVLQAFKNLATQRYNVLYISGEQRITDVALNAKRLGKLPAKLVAKYETDLDKILDIVDDRKPSIVAIDSVQAISIDGLEMGSAASIKTILREVVSFAKDHSTAFVLIGHLTKDGSIAGPQALSYYVDTTLYLEKIGDVRRILQTPKNRFGAAPRFADFEMTEESAGLIFTPDSCRKTRSLPVIKKEVAEENVNEEDADEDEDEGPPSIN